MARRYTRREFLDRLHAEIGRGRPLVMTGAGSGICAKFIERGGCDIIGVYNTGYFRMQGYEATADGESAEPVTAVLDFRA